MDAANFMLDALTEANREPFFHCDVKKDREMALGCSPAALFDVAFDNSDADIESGGLLAKRAVALVELRTRAVEAAECGNRAALDAVIREAEEAIVAFANECFRNES